MKLYRSDRRKAKTIKNSNEKKDKKNQKRKREICAYAKISLQIRGRQVLVRKYALKHVQNIHAYARVCTNIFICVFTYT